MQIIIVIVIARIKSSEEVNIKVKKTNSTLTKINNMETVEQVDRVIITLMLEQVLEEDLEPAEEQVQVLDRAQIVVLELVQVLVEDINPIAAKEILAVLKKNMISFILLVRVIETAIIIRK